MRKLRQYLATALIVSLVGSTMGMTAWARGGEVVPGKKHWDLANGEWHFYNSEGKLRIDEYRVVQGVWYAFNENGRMYENELFVGPGSQNIPNEDAGNDKPCPTNFAYPSGKLAAANAWVLLNHDGTLHEHDLTCGTDCDKDTDWYYFEQDYPEDQGVLKDYYGNYEGKSYDVGSIVAGREKEAKGGNGKANTYGFDNNGVMFSRQWVNWSDDGSIAEVVEEENSANVATDANWHFYNYQGARVTDKWRPIGDTWYRFDKDGKFVDKWASDSDAEAPNKELWLVESIKNIGEKEIEATLGQEIDLKFEVTLASDSNATFAAGKHDIWMPDAKRGSMVGGFNWSGKTCTITYRTSPTYIGTETLCLMVDGIPSEGVTITTKVESTKTESKDAVKTILDTMKDDNVSSGTAKESLAAVYNDAGDEGTTAPVKEEMKKALVADASTYQSLAASYAFENKIVEEDPKVDDSAAVLLPENAEIQLAGGSLNADNSGDKVKLSVKEGSTAGLPDEYKEAEAVAFDIEYLVNDSPKAELDLPVVVTMPLPTQFEGSTVKLLHNHDGKAALVESMKQKGNTVSFATDKFSDYIFVKTGTQPSPVDPTNPSRPSSSGSGGGSHTAAAGQWILDAIGWWYKDANGGYPYSTWRLLEYNKKMDWYHFNEKGYINTGWFTDVDGKIYYLNPISNGFMGMMLTGWQQIDGYWYYFNEQSDGSKGALYVNTMTPDGHRVNEKGQRVD